MLSLAGCVALTLLIPLSAPYRPELAESLVLPTCPDRVLADSTHGIAMASNQAHLERLNPAKEHLRIAEFSDDPLSGRSVCAAGAHRLRSPPPAHPR